LNTVLADEGRIEQVIMNLAVNARDAMPDGGVVCFETENCILHETRVGDDLRIPSGDYARLTVSDTGMGMDPDTRSHIFEPFFTTKGNRGGTGLGLSTVYGIVKQSGGYIWVYSEVEKGTVFKIYFPRFQGPERGRSDERAPVRSGRGETILVVEDDKGVLELAHSILKRGGYKVITARNGESALEIARDPQKTIDLVATDVVLPGMNGRDLAEGLAGIRPALKVLYMSGYGEETILRYGIQPPGAHFLEKPYSSVALLKAVGRAVDASLKAEIQDSCTGASSFETTAEKKTDPHDDV
jgi:two-component system cell cycle sensor histidine kinase/response regulator CckA